MVFTHKMLLRVFIISVFSQCLVYSFYTPGPKYPPTKGKIWPKPQFQSSNHTFYIYRPNVFEIRISNESCMILENAVARYKIIFKDMYQMSRRERIEGREWRLNPFRRHGSNYSGPLTMLQIRLTQPCEDYPHFNMDESYQLMVRNVSTLESKSIWGILRGLESFSQLFYLSSAFGEIRINTTNIVDFPAYKHRGLLIDTGRHYLSLPNILLTIDALEMNKMNVLHWHMVDDESFPFESIKFPQLSKKGAFYPTMVYTKENISYVIEYARSRGIRVIPEFDVPGHTRSWGEAVPNILTQCYKDGKVASLGPLNPIYGLTYVFLQQFLEEVQSRFPDQYLHMGGDEVDVECWSSNPEIQAYVERHNINVTDLQPIFMKAVLPLLNRKTIPIVWQEVFDANVTTTKKKGGQMWKYPWIKDKHHKKHLDNLFLGKEALIHVWKYKWVDEMIKILSAGYRVLFSASWYLDYLQFGWDSFYTADPRQMVYTARNSSDRLQNIVGGEACIWGEKADDTNIISRTWPRASAVAERLWSGFNYKKKINNVVTKEVRSRLEEHTCRMNHRGIRAEPPNGPGYCVLPINNV